MSKTKVTIIGMGRFGKVLLKLFRNDFSVTVFSRDQKKLKFLPELKGIHIAKNLSEALTNKVVFYAVPIGKFESIIEEHQSQISKDHLIIDVLSVKMHPAKVLQNICRATGARALLTHPMFGPDSTQDGFQGKILVMDSFNATGKEVKFWRNFFITKGIKVLNMSAKEHDQLAANSQGLAHFMGRLLEEIKFKPTKLDTQGAKKLYEIMQQTCNDTPELFRDLQTYNSHTIIMREKLIKAFFKIVDKLLPKYVNKNITTIGIQGGRGSFNESAIQEFISNKNIKNVKLKYLFTTKRVLKELNRGQIDLGIFAVTNSRGGLVDESLVEIGKHRFNIVGKITIPIQHFLMKRKDVALSSIKKIMAHDQVFKQCQKMLEKKYPRLKLIEGLGDLRDTAKAASALASGKINKNTAILGNILLAQIFGFEVIAKNLQDDVNNCTTFLVVKRM